MDFITSIKQAVGQLAMIRVIDVIDILLVAVLFYFILSLIRRTQISKVFTGVLIILLALWLSGEIQLYTVNYILRNAVQIGLLALVVLFQPEIRRFLEKLGTRLIADAAAQQRPGADLGERHHPDGAGLHRPLRHAHGRADHL
jgi:diadenylate cyclase